MITIYKTSNTYFNHVFVSHNTAPVECTPESLDLFVVLDGSRSVGYVNFGKVQAFLKKLSEEFLIGKDNAHFGVLQFGTVEGTRIEFNLDEYYSNRAVKEAIEKIQFLESRETQTGHALSVVSKEVCYCIIWYGMAWYGMV